MKRFLPHFAIIALLSAAGIDARAQSSGTTYLTAFYKGSFGTLSTETLTATFGFKADFYNNTIAPLLSSEQQPNTVFGMFGPADNALNSLSYTISGSTGDLRFDINGIEATSFDGTFQADISQVWFLLDSYNPAGFNPNNGLELAFSDWSAIHPVQMADWGTISLGANWNTDVMSFGGFVAQPASVPEPATYAFIGLGGLAIVMSYRRRVA